MLSGWFVRRIGDLLPLALPPDVRGRLSQHEQGPREHELPAGLAQRRARVPLDVSRPAGAVQQDNGRTVDRNVRRHGTICVDEGRTHVDTR